MRFTHLRVTGKFEYRNSKQIQITKISMTKTRNDLIMWFLFRILKIRISRLFRISYFDIRIFLVVPVI
jgi:hypothetical protein